MTPERTDGVFIIDKPLGLTSRDAVDRAQRWFARGTRIGHTGTLDPLASGVLVLCIGAATRFGEFIQDMPKEYHAEITLGARSATDDAEGPIEPVSGATEPDRDVVEASLAAFVGLISQVPPQFSAAKSSGRRAYDLARSGSKPELAARDVRVDRIDLVSYAYPTLVVEIRCGKGTYVRSIARDLGERLGCGGYVSALRRTRVGAFTSDQAVPLDADRDVVLARLLPIDAALSALPRIDLDDAATGRFRHGQTVTLPLVGENPKRNVTVAVFGSRGLVGVGTTDDEGRLVRPMKVLA